jgi:hypothetical protein
VLFQNKTAYDLLQHLHMPHVMHFNPPKIMRTAMVTQKPLWLNTSNARNNTVMPTSTTPTPGILWQKQPHFLVSQHFFSSVVSITYLFG